MCIPFRKRQVYVHIYRFSKIVQKCVDIPHATCVDVPVPDAKPISNTVQKCVDVPHQTCVNVPIPKPIPKIVQKCVDIHHETCVNVPDLQTSNIIILQVLQNS